MKRRTLGLLAVLALLAVVLFLGSIGEDLSESGVESIPTGAVIIDDSSEGKVLNEVTVPENVSTENRGD